MNSLDSLDREIRRLKRKTRQLEEKMDDNLLYFQEHFTSLALRSMLPRKTSEEGAAASNHGVLNFFLQNERLQESLVKLGTWSAAKLGEGINSLVDRILNKKD
jgi:hypothetical protein